MSALGVGSRGEPAQAAVRALRVVLGPPVLEQHLRLEQAVELLDGQELVAQPAVERLDVWILPRRAGLDVAAACAGEPAPVARALAVNSGPLSQRMYAGAVPRRATIPSSVEAVASAVMLLATTIASASRVCSSTMLSSFRTRPSAVWSSAMIRAIRAGSSIGTGAARSGVTADGCGSGRWSVGDVLRHQTVLLH